MYMYIIVEVGIFILLIQRDRTKVLPLITEYLQRLAENIKENTWVMTSIHEKSIKQLKKSCL